MAFDAVSKMESKKYEEKREKVETVKTMKEKQWERTLNTHSCSAVGISCVICLEEFRQGQVRTLIYKTQSSSDDPYAKQVDGNTVNFRQEEIGFGRRAVEGHYYQQMLYHLNYLCFSRKFVWYRAGMSFI